MTSKRLFLLLAIVAIALTGLAISAADGIADSKREVTFSKDVAPIFYKDCAQCHRPDDIAPMSLMSYKEARPWARSIKEKVATREMPPWDADPKYGEFSNVHRLSQQEIDTIVAWVDQGAKEGDPKDMPPVPKAISGWEIGKPDVILSMQEEYTVEVDAPDNYINFTIPTDFKEDKWIQAAEIHPGNKTVVHHVIAFIVTPEAKAKMKEAEKRGAARQRGEGGSIFYRDGTLSRVKMDAPVMDDGCGEPEGGRARQGRGEGSDGLGALLAGYAPGKGVDVWPEGMAKKVPAGSDIVFQMHYSNVFNGVKSKPVKDRTSLGLIFAKEVPDKAIMTFAIANHSFKIPAGAENHLVTACQTMRWDVEVITYMPHMHLRGKDMRYDIVYPDGTKDTLLSVPDFNFNWQTMYYLKKPVRIPKGSKLIVTAHFDNSKNNKYNPDTTKDVRWGDPTYDEMMIGWMDLVMPNRDKMEPAGRAGNK